MTSTGEMVFTLKLANTMNARVSHSNCEFLDYIDHQSPEKSPSLEQSDSTYVKCVALWQANRVKALSADR
jgi:hypothetical protein